MSHKGFILIVTATLIIITVLASGCINSANCLAARNWPKEVQLDDGDRAVHQRIDGE